MVRGLKVEVSGSPLIGKNIETFMSRLHARIIAIAPEAEYEGYNFARIEYRLTWTAEVFDINKVDTMNDRIKRLCSDYLEGWIYSINIHYHEKEGA